MKHIEIHNEFHINIKCVVMNVFLLIMVCVSAGIFSSCDDRVQSGSYGTQYDTIDKISITDLGEMVVLEHCEIATSDLVLPEKFAEEKSINYVGDSAFIGNDAIVNLTIPDGYTHIGHSSFANCKNLESVYIGKDLFDIGETAFVGCNNIENFSVSEANPYLYSVDGCVLTQSDNTLLASNGKIPEATKRIYHSVFRENRNLTNVFLPSGIEYIGYAAFTGSSVSSITLPAQLTTIESYAFANTELTEVYIPATVSTIGECVFSGIDGIVINCAAKSQPDNWDENWLGECENYQINWGVDSK